MDINFNYVIIGLICMLVFVGSYFLSHAIQINLEKSKKLKERLMSMSDARVTENIDVNIFRTTKEVGIFEEKIRQLLAPMKTSQQLQLWVQQTGLEINLIPLLINLFSLCVILIAIFAVVTNWFLLYIIFGVFGSVILIFYLVLSMIRSRHQQKIADDLPNALQMIAQFLKAGFNLDAALEICSKESNGPVANVIKKLLVQINSGVPYEDALRSSAERIGLNTYTVFMGALVIQHRIGASATLVIENIIFMLQKRKELEAKVKIMSAEATATYAILILTQIALAAALAWANPKQMQYFVVDPGGREWAGIIGILLLIQFVSFKWLTKIKVE